MNQLDSAAVAEKLSTMDTATYFAERAARGEVGQALEVLRRAGTGNPPLAGDELP